METIKDLELKKEIDNVIDKTLFSKFYRPIQEARDEKEFNEANNLLSTLETYKELDYDYVQGGIADGIIKNLNDFIRMCEENKVKREKSYELEDALFVEINNNFKENDDLEDGYRVYNVDYFIERLNIFRVSGLTTDFTKEEIRLQEMTGFINKKEK